MYLATQMLVNKNTGMLARLFPGKDVSSFNWDREKYGAKYTTAMVDIEGNVFRADVDDYLPIFVMRSAMSQSERMPIAALLYKELCRDGHQKWCGSITPCHMCSKVFYEPLISVPQV